MQMLEVFPKGDCSSRHPHTDEAHYHFGVVVEDGLGERFFVVAYPIPTDGQIPDTDKAFAGTDLCGFYPDAEECKGVHPPMSERHFHVVAFLGESSFMWACPHRDGGAFPSVTEAYFKFTEVRRGRLEFAPIRVTGAFLDGGLHSEYTNDE